MAIIITVKSHFSKKITVDGVDHHLRTFYGTNNSLNLFAQICPLLVTLYVLIRKITISCQNIWQILSDLIFVKMCLL